MKRRRPALGENPRQSEAEPSSRRVHDDDRLAARIGGREIEHRGALDAPARVRPPPVPRELGFRRGRRVRLDGRHRVSGIEQRSSEETDAAERVECVRGLHGAGRRTHVVRQRAHEKAVRLEERVRRRRQVTAGGREPEALVPRRFQPPSRGVDDQDPVEEPGESRRRDARGSGLRGRPGRASGSRRGSRPSRFR